MQSIFKTVTQRRKIRSALLTRQVIAIAYCCLPTLTLLAAPRATAECLNVWINPRTGQSECLDHASSAIDRSSVAGLKRLQQCQPSVVDTPFPLAPNQTARITIHGRVRNRCFVEMMVPPPSGQSQPQFLERCHYSQATIALLTDKTAQAEAKAWDATHTFTVSTDLTSRQQVLSKRFSQECEFFGTPPIAF